MDVIFFFQAEDGIRDIGVTGVQTCALPICGAEHDVEHLRQVDLQGRRALVVPRAARGRQGRHRLEVEGRLRRAAARRDLALGHLPDHPHRRERRGRRPRGVRLEDRRGAAVLPAGARHSRGRGLQAHRQRVHRADRQGAPDGVRGRDEPADRAPDGGLHRMSAATIELPRFKGRPGWEFTDISGFDPAAFVPAPGDAELAAPEPLLEGPAEAVRLLQVDGSWDAGLAVEDGPVVLPLSVALERHPELVEPWLGTVVSAAGDPFAPWNAASWEGGAFVYLPRVVRVGGPGLLTAVTGAAGTALHRRTLIVVEEGAEAEVWEQFQSGSEDAETLVTTVVELVG